ncbi:MAG: hypothetical protein ACOC29_00075 [Candidatus Sumerlaeota bacterium]
MPEFLCRSHPDFHMPAEVEIGKDFDYERYAVLFDRSIVWSDKNAQLRP